jgi:hypothetical protein
MLLRWSLSAQERDCRRTSAPSGPAGGGKACTLKRPAPRGRELRPHGVSLISCKFQKSEPAEAMEHLHYPNESDEYRAARNALLDDEISLRAQIETVAAKRRALPLGGEVPQDYVFERIGRTNMPETVKMSELFGPHNTLILYSFMYGPQRTVILTEYDIKAHPLRRRLFQFKFAQRSTLPNAASY